jgi:NAD(P)-dependent dehydrogenase (short-subunit alcohol dehydrogenase family)
MPARSHKPAVFQFLLDIAPQTAQKPSNWRPNLASLHRRTDIASARLGGMPEGILRFGRSDILINNANDQAGKPRGHKFSPSRILQQWTDIDVGLTGAFLCSKTLGSEMAKGRGVIVNVASILHEDRTSGSEAGTCPPLQPREAGALVVKSA